MIHVLATIEVEAGKRTEFLTHLHWVTPLVRAEDGCLEYIAAIDTPTPIPVQATLRPDTVMVIEKWSTLEALQTHLQATHMAEYRKRVQGLVKSVSLQVLENAV